MSVSLKSLGIERLSVEERLLLVEGIWDSIAAATPLTDPNVPSLIVVSRTAKLILTMSFPGKRLSPLSPPA